MLYEVITGAIVPLNLPILQPADTKQLCYSILTDVQKRKFEEENELDLILEFTCL